VFKTAATFTRIILHMLGAQLYQSLISRLQVNGIIDDGDDTTWFLLNDENLMREVIDLFETLPCKSLIIKGLTLNVWLDPNEKRFQMVDIDDARLENFPQGCICVEGILNAVGMTNMQVLQLNKQCYDDAELTQIQDVLGVII
jgi:hypothetical protein